MTIEVYMDAYGESRNVDILRRHSVAERERVTHEHDADWLESPEAFQFDPTLPLRRGTLHPGAIRFSVDGVFQSPQGKGVPSTKQGATYVFIIEFDGPSCG